MTSAHHTYTLVSSQLYLVATFQAILNKKIKPALVKCLTGIQKACSNCSTPSEKVITHLIHKPAALSGLWSCLIPKLHGIRIKFTSPDLKYNILKQLENLRCPCNCPVRLKLTRICQASIKQGHKCTNIMSGECRITHHYYKPQTHQSYMASFSCMHSSLHHWLLFGLQQESQQLPNLTTYP